MKQLAFLFIALISISLVGCDVGVNPTDSVGVGPAFKHLAEKDWYIPFNLAITALLLYAWYWVYKNKANKEIQDESMIWPTIGVVFGLIILWLAPAAILGNETSVGSAAKGTWGF